MDDKVRVGCILVFGAGYFFKGWIDNQPDPFRYWLAAIGLVAASILALV